MPTILRFRNFRVVIYLDDHEPAHVHVQGPGVRATFYLNCPEGPVLVRENFGVSDRDLAALGLFLSDNLGVLCAAWEELHGS
jgi:hypothetical protein